MQGVTVQVDLSGAAAAALRLGVLSAESIAQRLASGLAAAAEEIAGDIVLRAVEAGLQSRTGSLLGSVGSWPAEGDGQLTVYVGVPDDSPAARYSYLLGEQYRVIRPQGHKYLAIPIGENLTGAGVARYASPRQVDDLVFRGRTAGILQEERYVPLFALVEEVTIVGRGVFEAAIEAAAPTLPERVRGPLDALLAEVAG